ncbi:hypothetical protein SCOR_09265 [Sulfidibacter corallicola]|uniref:FlgO domain-containing protein n=1 Tax=Sulfidibacter corallicola TaxID=2818388 RepID=A0A8A4TNC1_SULCO|nr:hypothetical protein [Sulfidibacter corallicola]QTD51053.1 hypothetical protein J3U87_01170 [Sulfidibacter corallicola]
MLNTRYRKILGLCLIIWGTPTLVLGWSGNTYDVEFGRIAGYLEDVVVNAPLLSATQKNRFGVLTFTDDERRRTKLGQFLAEDLSMVLKEVSTVTILDHDFVQFQFDKAGIGTSELDILTQLDKIREIVDVDYLIVGSYVVFGDNIRIFMKVTDIQTGVVVGVTRGYLSNTMGIHELLAEKRVTLFERESDDPKSTSVSSVEQAGIQFDMQKLVHETSRLSVHMLATSKGQDRTLTLSSRSGTDPARQTRVIDDQGMEYLASTVQVGKKESAKEASNLLAADIPLQIVLHFDSIPQPPKTLKLVEVFGKSDSEPIQFRLQELSMSEIH